MLHLSRWKPQVNGTCGRFYCQEGFFLWLPQTGFRTSLRQVNEKILLLCCVTPMRAEFMPRQKVEFTVDDSETREIGELAAEQSGLDLDQVKDAMAKGALWLKENGKPKYKRFRRYDYVLHKGDEVVLNYKGSFLSEHPLEAKLLFDRQRYSVWYKPVGVMSRGNEFGDHFSIVRMAHIHFKPYRHAHYVHSMDSSADGLMLIAHDKLAAAKLVHLRKHGGMETIYRVVVQGRPEGGAESGVIDEPLDGQPASTRWEVVSYAKDLDRTELRVHMEPGCKHQIRRHLHSIGTPVVGDRQYRNEAGNKDSKKRQDMLLTAISLCFECPIEHQPVEFILPEKLD